jgi:hypothetical protein
LKGTESYQDVRLTGLLTAFALLAYVVVAMAGVAAIVIAPAFLLVEACKGVAALVRPSPGRRPATRERAHAELELREQYASGMLTLVGLEERFEEVQRARSHLELGHVLEDLPQRARPFSRSARYEICAGLAVLLTLHSLLAQAIGAAIVLGALLPGARWRPTAIAFAAGAALFVVPPAGVALAVSAAFRWRDGAD